MIGRFLILVLVSVTASGLWWALWAGHRSRLRDTVRAEPNRALVFTSPDCAGCRTQEAILKSLDPELRNRIRRVDVTSNPEEATRFGIRTLPTIVFTDSKGEVAAISYGITESSTFQRRMTTVMPKS